MKINILMSTYNGEMFLADQIKSIQNQTVKDWTLYIRDDGSVIRQEILLTHTPKPIHGLSLSIPNIKTIWE